MDFAAAAVFDSIAAAPPARPAPVDEAHPSFDDHLEAQRPEARDPGPRADASEDTPAPNSDQQPQPAIVAAPTAPIPAAPIVLQLTLGAAPAPQATPDDARTAEATPASPPGPQQIAPPLPARAPVAKLLTPRPSDASDRTSEPGKAAAVPTPDAPAPVTPIASVDAAPKSDIVARQAAAPQTQPLDAAFDALAAIQGAAPRTQPLDAAFDALAAVQAAAQGLKPTRTLRNEMAQASESSASFELDAEQTPRAHNPNDTGKTQGKAIAQPLVFATDVAVTQRPAVQDAPAPPPLVADASMLAPQGAPHTQHIPIDAAAVRAAPVAAQIGREIVRRFNGQNTQFDLRLDPPELGRVEIRLEVSRDHRVTAIVAADNPQALAELVRHARELEQSLQSAGLQLADNGLSFDLRQGRDGSREAQNEAGDTAPFAETRETETPAPTPFARPVGFERWRGVRLDVIA